MAIAELPENRFQILSAQAMAGTTVYSPGLNVERFNQAILEIYPTTFTGDMSFYIEFSQTSENGPWMPDTLEDTSNGTTTDNEFAVPLLRYVRTWSESGAAVQIPVPIAYRFMRVGAKASGGAVTICVKLTNARGL